MDLTEHFTLEELIFSSTGLRLAIDNLPSAEIVEHLKVTAAGLEQVRSLLGEPLLIDSGYRSVALNKAVGGVPSSAHVTGYAADFVCPSFGAPMAIVHAIVYDSSIEFDQVIQEGTWVHISFAPGMRNEVLTAHFAGGKATYSEGA